MIIQREFANKDYEGLDATGKRELRNQRNRIAGILRRDRNSNNLKKSFLDEFSPSKIKKHLENRNKNHSNDLKNAIKDAREQKQIALKNTKERYKREVKSRAKHIKNLRESSILKAGKYGLGAAVGLVATKIGNDLYKKYKNK